MHNFKLKYTSSFIPLLTIYFLIDKGQLRLFNFLSTYKIVNSVQSDTRKYEYIFEIKKFNYDRNWYKNFTI